MYRRRYRGRQNPLLAGLILFFIGFIFVIVAAVFLFINQAFLAGAVSTTGRIVACTYSVDSGPAAISLANSTCQPTVTFTTQSGQEITFTSSFSSSSYNKGDNVQVSYHPNHPADARISDFIALWLFPLIFGGVGALLWLIGACLIGIPLLFRLTLVQAANGR
ncbi:hypothetical protein KDK_54710 [Dictyobacter kobayashii]|uniref:DUF3592 domain-containing protein n=2 Tax=Dictyobacter kobayashii TaxID=2014872 RepID=A0A402ARE1_9CHLR|nr:hypothetical protein KDK_54710 [Dictyobacter kobayashii]